MRTTVFNVYLLKMFTRTYLKGDVLDGLHRSSVQIVVVLTSFYKQMCLYICLHLINARHKMIIPSVHFVLPLRSGGVGDAGTEPVGELPHQVVVDPVLDGPQDDDGPRELEINLLHGLVGQDLSISTIVPASWKTNINTSYKNINTS